MKKQAVTDKRGRPKRRRSPLQANTTRLWPEDEHDERLRDALARELIGECMKGLKTFGLDANRLAKLAAEAAAGTSDRNSSAAKVLTDADRLGNAASKWSEEPGYRDSTGRPAVLSVRDSSRHSFASLAQECFPGRSLADVISLGCKNKVFERVGTDRLALLNSQVLFPGNSPVIMASIVRTVRRVFLAADVNRRITSGNPEGWPERAVWVEVSEDDFREFVRFIRPQIGALIEVSNRWLTRHSALPKNRLKKKRLSGLQVLVYRE